MKDRFEAELNSFSTLWKGGYYEGDPLDPMSPSSYGQLGYLSTLHATYLACIKPYVHSQTVAFEIGPGRGAWTKTLLPSAEVWAVDALSAEHNGFLEYLNHPPNVRYIQVEDFTLGSLPDDHFTFMFSFGALCHVSFDGIKEYAQSAFSKMARGSHCFWMVADYAKYNASVRALDTLSPWTRCLPRRRKNLPARAFLRALRAFDNPPVPLQRDSGEAPSPGRWYDAGTDRTCSMLQDVGFEILDRDMGVSHRDPVIHFIKN